MPRRTFTKLPPLVLAATLILLALLPASASASLSPGEPVIDPKVDAWLAVARASWGRAFTGDGRVLISSDCCRRSRAVGWDVRSGVRVFDVPATTFAISPDSRVIAAGTADGHVSFFEPHSGKRLGPAVKVAGGQIAQLAISPDGRLLGVGAWDATATVWDLRSRSRLGDVFPVAPGLIPAVAFEPSGRLLITELGSAIEWPLDRATLQRFACQVAGRELSRAEWQDLLPTRPHRPACGAPDARGPVNTDG